MFHDPSQQNVPSVKINMAYGRLFVNVSVNIKDMATRVWHVWHKMPLCTDQKIIFLNICWLMVYIGQKYESQCSAAISDDDVQSTQSSTKFVKTVLKMSTLRAARKMRGSQKQLSLGTKHYSLPCLISQKKTKLHGKKVTLIYTLLACLLCLQF